MNEIAALCALQDALEGVDFSELDIYVGVSSGAFIASMATSAASPVGGAAIATWITDCAAPGRSSR